jgi:hypothetical protein
VGTGRRLADTQRSGRFNDAFKVRRIDILAVENPPARVQAIGTKNRHALPLTTGSAIM